jgi:8-O-methyltransferase
MHHALHSDLTGPEVIRSTWRSLHASFSELRFELDDIVAGGDVVAVRGTTTGRHTGVFRGIAGTGKQIAQRAHMFYRFDGNRIAEVWPLVDHAGLHQQLTGPADPIDDELQYVLDVATGFWRAQALFSANELGLFTLLSQGPATLEKIRTALGLHENAAQDFLDALSALELIRREDGSYENSAAAARYLDETQDTYIGGFFKFMNHALYSAWGRLIGLLRTGRRQAGVESFGDWYSDLDQVRVFMEAMDSVSMPVVERLVARPEWEHRGTFVDLGGARGNLAGRLALSHPHLSGICFDLPALAPLFDEHMARLGTAERVRFNGGDFRTDELPSTDVLIFGDALNDGGLLMIYDELLDGDRAGPARSLLMSLNMRLVRSGGSEYTNAEALEWLTKAGFTDVEVEPLTATERLILARKP